MSLVSGYFDGSSGDLVLLYYILLGASERENNVMVYMRVGLG